MPPITTSPDSRRKLIWIIGAAALLIAVVALVLFWMRATPNLASGSLVVRLPGEWTSPNGEVLSGIVTYTPAYHAFYLNYGPSLGEITILDLLPGGDSAFAVTPNGLVEVSRLSQEVTKTLVRLNSDEQAHSPVRSRDGQTVAYLSIPSLGGLPSQYPIEPGDDPLLRLDPALDLPTAFVPQLRIVRVGGDVLHMVRGLQPLAFSPDSAHILALGADGLTTVSVADGTQASLAGTGALAGLFGTVEASRDGTVLLVQDPATETAGVYTFAWPNATLAHVGSTTPGTSSLLPDGKVAVHSGSTNTVTIYEVRDGRLVAVGAYDVILPAGAEILEWNQ